MSLRPKAAAPAGDADVSDRDARTEEPIDLSEIRWSRTASDSRRASIALVVSFAVPFVVATTIDVIDPAWDHGVPIHVVFALLGWNLFAALYVILTVLTFRSHGPEVFAALMAARREREPRLWAAVDKRGDGPIFAIESAIIAFAVVLVLPHIDAIRLDELLLVPITLTILISSWGVAVVSYALHYAQHDLAEPSLEFPGERTNAWADYLYFSLAVATTFGATDVNITRPQMRRVVNLHTVLTFIYNSVIVALLASLLIR